MTEHCVWEWTRGKFFNWNYLHVMMNMYIIIVSIRYGWCIYSLLSNIIDTKTKITIIFNCEWHWTNMLFWNRRINTVMGRFHLSSWIIYAGFNSIQLMTHKTDYLCGISHICMFQLWIHLKFNKNKICHFLCYIVNKLSPNETD